MKVEINCAECGKPFEVYQSEIDRGGGKFCSPACGYENKRDRVNVFCAWCGKEFETRPYEINRGQGKYCSLSCSQSNRAGLRKGYKQSPEHVAKRIQSGEDHYNWKGGVKIQNGYRFIRQEGGGYKQEHRIIGEKVLGRPLKSTEVVHHVNGDRADNRNKNLVICDTGYHSWLHRTQESL